jgi:hypothetical protein
MFSPSLLGLLRKRTLFVESEFLKSNELGSEPDLVKSEKTPDTKRRRYHSKNDKESRNSTQPIASFRGKDVHYDGSLTPVGSELDVHTQ